MSTAERALSALRPEQTLGEVLLNEDGPLADQSDELKRHRRDHHGGVLVDPGFIKAALTTTGTSSGAELQLPAAPGRIGYSLRPGLIRRTPAIIETSIRAPVAPPSFGSETIVAWQSTENPSPGPSSVTPTTYSDTPDGSLGMVGVEWTRRWDRQAAGGGGAALIGREALRAVDAVIDTGALAGTGQNGEPVGLIRRAETGAIQSVAIGANGGALTLSAVTQLEELIGAGDAPEPYLFATSPQLRRAARRTLRGAAGDGYLIDGPSRMIGWPVLVSSAIPSDVVKGNNSGTLSALIIGGWSSLIVFLHSVEFVIDRITGAGQGLISMWTYVVMSVGVLNDGAQFAAIIDADTVVS